MSFPKFQQDWGSKSQAVKQRKTLQKRRKGALRSRQEQVANEILMYFRSQKKLQGEVSLSDSIDTDKEGNALQLMDVVGVDDTMLEDLHDRDSALRLHQLIRERLTAREAEIVRLRYGLGGTVPLTQREIASSFGISRSYVSRIEKRALEKLRAGLTSPVTPAKSTAIQTHSSALPSAH